MVNKLRYYYTLMEALEANDPDHPRRRLRLYGLEVVVVWGVVLWWCRFGCLWCRLVVCFGAFVCLRGVFFGFVAD